jgi:hypothetical protein
MPAREWAETTDNNVLETQNPSTPLHTPGLRIPGSFLEDPKPEAVSGGGETLLDTAKRYLPAQDDVQRAMTNAGQAAKGYLPQSVASYLRASFFTSHIPVFIYAFAKQLPRRHPTRN